MKRFFKMFFRSNSAIQQTIKNDVIASRIAVEQASNKFEAVMGELLESNDRLRQGKRNEHQHQK